MMVTWISPSYWSSMTAPKMTLALGSAKLVTTSETLLTYRWAQGWVAGVDSTSLHLQGSLRGKHNSACPWRS